MRYWEIALLVSEINGVQKLIFFGFRGHEMWRSVEFFNSFQKGKILFLITHKIFMLTLKNFTFTFFLGYPNIHKYIIHYIIEQGLNNPKNQIFQQTLKIYTNRRKLNFHESIPFKNNKRVSLKLVLSPVSVYSCIFILMTKHKMKRE